MGTYSAPPGKEVLSVRKIQIDFYRHQNPVVNDAYDRLMANIHLRRVDSGLKSLMLTAATPGSGTTSLAINLSVSIATSGLRTLLVDTDMRKASEEKRLSEKVPVGLSAFLQGEVSFDDIVNDTNIPLLSYISCGIASENPVPLLCSNRFEVFMRLAKEQFDFILLDSPALDASVDASLLALRADGVVLVANCQSNTSKQMKSSLSEIERTGRPCLGVILNKMDRNDYKRFLKNYDYFYKKRRPNLKKENTSS